MKDHVQLWFETLRQGPAATVPLRIEVIGEYDKHTGPAWPRASVRMVVEPADAFELVDEVPDRNDLSGFPYADRIVTGLLSVLMTAYWSPILKVNVTLKELKIDPVETTLMAFEMAGRDAGRKILEAMKHR